MVAVYGADVRGRLAETIFHSHRCGCAGWGAMGVQCAFLFSAESGCGRRLAWAAARNYAESRRDGCRLCAGLQSEWRGPAADERGDIEGTRRRGEQQYS